MVLEVVSEYVCVCSVVAVVSQLYLCSGSGGCAGSISLCIDPTTHPLLYVPVNCACCWERALFLTH